MEKVILDEHKFEPLPIAKQERWKSWQMNPKYVWTR
jgi:hypothetical protein